MEQVGLNIRKRRKQYRLTQKQLADICGLSNSYLSDIEVGRTNPSLKTLEKLSEALECRIKDFF